MDRTRSATPALADLVHVGRLGPALAAATGERDWLAPEVELIGGGKSNLTFLLHYPDRDLILRRPPRGAKAKSAHDMNREFTIQSKLAPVFGYVPDTHFHASFGHLEGYSSAYYTYMWSLVIAKDMFSAFDENDLFAEEVAHRYRDAWDHAADRTPHGQPIELRADDFPS